MTSLKTSTEHLSLENMDPEKSALRFYVFVRLKLGDGAKKILEDIHTVFGDSCVCQATVYNWISEFSGKKKALVRDDSRGRPSSALNEQKIAEVKALVEVDPHSTIRELSEASDLSIGSISNILHKGLLMRKLAARWVPHLLTEEQKKRRVDCARNLIQYFEPNGPKRLCDVVTGDETWLTFYGIPNKRCNRAWVGPDGDRPVVLRPGFQSRKRLFTVFFQLQRTRGS